VKSGRGSAGVASRENAGIVRRRGPAECYGSCSGGTKRPQEKEDIPVPRKKAITHGEKGEKRRWSTGVGEIVGSQIREKRKLL